MLKTVTAFKIANLATGMLIKGLSAQFIPLAADPDATQWSSAGFTNVPNKECQIYEGANGLQLFSIQKRERILPARVIRSKMDEKIKEIEERQGRRVGRKEAAEIKEEVIAALLPTAFIKPSSTLCMLVSDYLFIGSGSARTVDLCISNLRACYPNDTLHFQPIQFGRNAVPWMTELLLNNTTECGYFNLADSLTLKGEGKKATKFKCVDLESRAVLDSFHDGQKPSEIAVTYKERVTFVLTDAMVLKRIAFLDVILKDSSIINAEDAAASFDATVAIVSGELRELLDALLSEIRDKKADEEEL